MKRNGFTLVEVLVATAILLVSLLTIVNLILLGVIYNSLSANKTMATLTASSQLALLRAGGVAKLEEWKNKNVYHEATAEEQKECSCSGWYSNVALIPAAASEQLYRVTITIICLDGREETFVTYLVDMGKAEGPAPEQPIKIYQRE